MSQLIPDQYSVQLQLQPQTMGFAAILVFGGIVIFNLYKCKK